MMQYVPPPSVTPALTRLQPLKAADGGVIALLWDHSQTGDTVRDALFLWTFPKDAIPDDLPGALTFKTDASQATTLADQATAPKPAEWNTHLSGYYDSALAQSCLNALKPQRFILDLDLCGQDAVDGWSTAKDDTGKTCADQTRQTTCGAYIASDAGKTAIKAAAYKLNYVRVFAPTT
jgi:hypothetical protein